MADSPISTATPKLIGVAIVVWQEMVLVGVRGEGVPLAGFAEFPGGKCEPGEDSAECARRECLEEAELEVVPEACLLQKRHAYHYGTVELHFWKCTPQTPTDVAIRHRSFFWIPISELSRWRFPEGNLEVIQLLTGNSQS